MLDILHESPIVTGDMTICFDREPDIFLMPRIRYDHSEYMGFFFEDRLQGFAMMGYERAWIDRRPTSIFHFTDCYVRREARGKELIYKSFEIFFEQTHENAQTGYAVVMKGNRAAESYIGRRKQGFSLVPYSRKIGELDVRNIIITFSRKADSPYIVRHAKENDVGSIVALLRRDFRERLFAPCIDDEKFLVNLEKRPGLGIGDYYVAEEKGSPVGVCAAWDTSSFKQNRILRYSSRFRTKKLLYSLLGLLFGFPPLPGEGGSFRDVHITDFATRERDPGIMKALLHAVYGECRAKKYNTIIFGSSSDDPLLEAADGFMTERLVSHIILGGITRDTMEDGAISIRLPYIDIAQL